MNLPVQFLPNQHMLNFRTIVICPKAGHRFSTVFRRFIQPFSVRLKPFFAVFTVFMVELKLCGKIAGRNVYQEIFFAR